MNLDDIKKIYFLGIGGIGMSALARYFNKRGVEVHGYDKTKIPLTNRLVKEGMHIHFDENIGHIPPGVDLVVRTPAVPEGHRELQHFLQTKTPMLKRAEVLGRITSQGKCIAIAGTHGKTTTSSLLAHLLRIGDVDCTAFLGGIAQNFDSNFVAGKGEWYVAEADEYDRSFLQLEPDIAVLLSMDADHLDIYGDAGAVAETGFKEFIKKVKPNGKVFMKHDLAQYFDGQSVDDGRWEGDGGRLFETFGLEKGRYRSENIRVENGFFRFDFVATGWQGQDEFRLNNLRLEMPGRHNVENATAAVAVALQLGVDALAIRKGLGSFKGISRRFEQVYKNQSSVYIDDYAHHPTEIRSAVQAARELYPGRHLTGIFQPHLFTRTRDFQDGFAEELDKLDDIILLDIYPAREEPIEGVTSQIVFDKMQNPNKVLLTKAEVMKELKNRQFDVLMTIGAGDVDTLVMPIRALLKKREK